MDTAGRGFLDDDRVLGVFDDERFFLLLRSVSVACAIFSLSLPKIWCSFAKMMGEASLSRARLGVLSAR